MASLANYLTANGMLAFDTADFNNLELDGVAMSTSGGGSGGSGSIAGSICYTNSVSQTVSGNQALILGSIASADTFGTTSLTAVTSDGNVMGFQNTGSSSIFVIITAYCSFTSSLGGSSSDNYSYALWCEKNNDLNNRYGLSEQSDDNDYVTLNSATSMQLAPNDTVAFVCWTNNSSNTVNASSASFPGLRFHITQLNQGSGGSGGSSQNLGEVLGVGNDAGGVDIVDVGNLSINKYFQIGSAVSNSSQIHLCYDTGDTSGKNYQLSASGDNLISQYYNGDSLVHQSFQISGDGSVTLGDTMSSIPYVYVTSSSGTKGRVYDSVYNTPPSSGSGGDITLLQMANETWSTDVLIPSIGPISVVNFNQTSIPSSNFFEFDIGTLSFNVDSYGSGVSSVVFKFYLSPSALAFDSTKANSIQVTLTGGTNPTVPPAHLYFGSSTNYTNIQLCVEYVSGTYSTNNCGLSAGTCIGTLKCYSISNVFVG